MDLTNIEVGTHCITQHGEIIEFLGVKNDKLRFLTEDGEEVLYEQNGQYRDEHITTHDIKEILVME